MVKSVTLAMLDAKSKKITPFKIKVDGLYPDNAFFTFLDRQPFSVDCRRCKDGEIIKSCRECETGKCRNCNGTGEISYDGLGKTRVEEKTCPTCQGLKVCRKCNGLAKETTPCYTCRSRGVIYRPSVFKSEYKKSIDYLIGLSVTLAQENNVNIGVGATGQITAKVQSKRKAEQERLIAEKEKIELERQKRIAQIEKEKERRKTEREEKSGNSDGDVYTVVEGGSNEYLDHALLELEYFLRSQKRVVKMKLHKSAKCSFQKGIPTLFLEISDEFHNTGKDYKEQVFDGLNRYWAMRVKSNGLGSKSNAIFLHDGVKVGGVNEDGTVFVK